MFQVQDNIVTPPGRVEFPSMEAKSIATDPVGQALGLTAMEMKRALDTLPLTWEQKAGVAMIVAVMVVGEAPNLKARRGKVINHMTEEMRAKLQAFLPL